MYIGRFAPSPTGPLHFGSLVTAVASYCEAKVNHGKWLVRMEDVDASRAIAGADAIILGQLAAFGFVWDGDVMYQTARTQAYMQALALLQTKKVIYPCTCTRKEIADSANAQGIDGFIYPKTCLIQATKPNVTPALRVKTQDIDIAFTDAVYGHICQNISRDIGDFILQRADQLFTYQLAVVVDDDFQDITHIVRGADLLQSTPRQIYLQQLLGFSTPQYLHVPLVRNADGDKLSKHTQASPLAINANDSSLITHQLYSALMFLGQTPPETLLKATANDIWAWAFANWQLKPLRTKSIS